MGEELLEIRGASISEREERTLIVVSLDCGFDMEAAWVEKDFHALVMKIAAIGVKIT